MQAGGLAVRIAGGHRFGNHRHGVMMVVPSTVASTVRGIRGLRLRFAGHMVAMSRRESGRGQKRKQRGHREERSYGIHTLVIVAPADGFVKARAAAPVLWLKGALCMKKRLPTMIAGINAAFQPGMVFIPIG